MSVPLDKMVGYASIFAADAHRGQKRKYTGESYFTHVRDVAHRVAKKTSDPEVIAAAYLHDTLEDTETEYAALVEEFGHRVANIVLELTDVYTKDRYHLLNRAQRKANECLRLARVSQEAKLIKLADIADNTSSIVEHDPKFAKVYLKEKAALLEVLV